MSEKITIALIEHGSRPIAYLVIGCLVVIWLFSVRDPVSQMLGQTQTLKVGSFLELVRASATKEGLEDSLSSLRGMDDDQLQLFLVIGKGGKHITYRGEQLTEPNPPCANMT